jgi:hypothetical protein
VRRALIYTVPIAVCLLALVASAAPAEPSARCQLKWRAIPSPRLAHGSLSDVHALTPTDVWAVGRHPYALSDRAIVVEHWDGRRWRARHLATRASVGGPYLSARSKRDVWIAANTEQEKPMILHYDGRSWTRMPELLAQTERGVLGAILALAPDDAWAVGEETLRPYDALIFHWNGTRWKRVDAALGVTYVSGLAALTPHDLWAVAFKKKRPRGGVLIHWNGTVWRVVSTALRGIPLRSLTAVSSSDLWSVGMTATEQGQQDRAVVTHWNGRAFRVVRRIGRLSSVVLADISASGHYVWAVGTGGIEQWNGRRWRRIRMKDARLWGADALSPGNVWAVGDRAVDDSPDGTAIYHRACH